MWEWHGFSGGGFMWVFWILIIAAVVMVIKASSNTKNNEKSHPESPLDILKRRYASGEIDKEEFHKRKRDLSE